MEPHEVVIVSIVLILMVGMVINAKSLSRIFFSKTDYSTKTLNRWYFSEIQGEWVLPTEPPSKKEVYGSVYLGEEIFEETWINFHKN